MLPVHKIIFQQHIYIFNNNRTNHFFFRYENKRENIKIKLFTAGNTLVKKNKCRKR